MAALVPIDSGPLPPQQWRALQAEHRARMERWVVPHLERRRAKETHPVYDFLFDYYHQTPGQLVRWHPGLGVSLLEGEEFLALSGYRQLADGRVAVDPGWLKAHRRESVAWIGRLLKATAVRPPVFGCFGLHEWAMVYRAPEVRHSKWPLRYAPEALARIVESLPIRCSHFDAFRFFTPEARPLNRLTPSRDQIPHLEQRGCLHANMDLYKWAFKLTPFVASHWVAEAFELAVQVREVDMRASPYDLRALGFEPIPVESPEGRAEYERHQRRFAEAGVPIRQALLEVCEALLAAVGEEGRV